MKCPRCGGEMTRDDHRKYPIDMCYNCGYTESRGNSRSAKVLSGTTNFEHLKRLNFNEFVAFVGEGLGCSANKLSEWLTHTC